MLRRSHLSIAFAAAIAATNVGASQFYIFPVKEIEGLSERATETVRPLVDRRVVKYFTPEMQRDLLGYFVAGVASIYPQSTVHARQVRDTVKGSYKFVNNDNQACGEGFVAPVGSAYAIAIGVTRASYFEVDRGANVELLIPLTINLQLIKPERGKIAYTISETIYTPFLFTKQEMGLPKTAASISNALADNSRKLISSLLETARRNFNPNETPVRIIGRDGKFLVANKGFEIGFQPGLELEAVTAAGKQALFRVISVDSGYTVLLPIAGSVSEGEDYLFTFETGVDDARKPKLMPVTSNKPEKLWSNRVAELFAKDIGFNAPFQLAPVDVNFSDTMDSVRALANCVPWDKYPAARTVSDSRSDAPQFFLRFEHSLSPVALNKAANSVKTSETFISAVSAQVVDNDGNVVFAELGSDRYELDKVDNRGLSLANAQEVALKNATSRLAENFRKSIKLTPTDFRIARVSDGNFWVDGLPATGQNIVYEVLRPLSVSINGKPALMKQALDGTTQPPEQDGGQARFAYSISSPDVPKPEKGDIVRVLTPLRGHLPEMSACGDIYRAEGSLKADYLAPLFNHVAYRSPRYLVSISDADFYSDANRLLASGFYRFRLPHFTPTEFCFKPGYKLVQKSGECKESCTSTFLSAGSVIVEKGGARTQQAVVAQEVTIEGFAEAERNNFIGLKSMEESLRTLEDLSRKFNPK
ncbi:hypothetical protein [Rhodocyclus tenuis]|uniref:Uncharacterized protein n=1 Tax=Rhodocyclus tenuis TaxID=1066 RepID=A0A840GCN6_RHOTE|nr:hypothetical protein [Rhodocyclus tenuis]MBB4248408.1 hypothetical protein [Rhodocyclus tenuis]